MTQTNRFSKGLTPLLLILLVLCSVLAIQLRRGGRRDSLEQMRTVPQPPSSRGASARNYGVPRPAVSDGTKAAGGEETMRGDNTKAPGSADTPVKVYKLLELLAQKDATIRELSRQIREQQSRGTVLADGSSTGRPPQRVWTPRKRKPGREEEDRQGTGLPAEPMVGNIAEQEEFFSSIDVSGLSPAQQEEHAELRERLAGIRDLLRKAGESPDDQETRALRAEISRNVRNLDELLRRERDIIFYNTGRNLGYDEESARWFADYLGYVNDMTSLESASPETR